MEKQKMRKMALMIPLFIAFLWMGYLVIDQGSAEPDVQLSPGKLNSLITALFIFIIAYSLVLAGLFYSMSRSLKHADLDKMVHQHHKKH